MVTLCELRTKWPKKALNFAPKSTTMKNRFQCNRPVVSIDSYCKLLYTFKESNRERRGKERQGETGKDRQRATGSGKKEQEEI